MAAADEGWLEAGGRLSDSIVCIHWLAGTRESNVHESSTTCSSFPYYVSTLTACVGVWLLIRQTRILLELRKGVNDLFFAHACFCALCTEHVLLQNMYILAKSPTSFYLRMWKVCNLQSVHNYEIDQVNRMGFPSFLPLYRVICNALILAIGCQLTLDSGKPRRKREAERHCSPRSGRSILRVLSLHE